MSVLTVVELEAFRNYAFSWDELSEDHYLVAGEQHDLEACLGWIKQTAHASPWIVDGEKPGETLLQRASYLIPEAVVEKMASGRAPLNLRTQAADLPWELALAETVVARQATGQLPKSLPSEGPVALWAGISHPGVFSWAKPAVEACVQGWAGKLGSDTGLGLLTDAKVGVAYLLAGVSPSGELALEGLTVNLASWVPRQVHKARKVCRCLFLHLVDHEPHPVYHVADRVAQALLELGVETAIVTFWQPDLEQLPKALERFFGVLKAGTVGEAFQALRDSFPADDERLSRWAFGLYGNAELEGRALVPLRVGSSQSATTVPKFGKADYRLKITSGPDSGREVPVFSHTLAAGQRLVVGRAGLKRCQIEVKDPALAPEAFAFEWEGVEAYLVNLSETPEGVTVEGLPVRARLHLEGSHKICSGGSEFVFTPVSGPVATSSHPCSLTPEPLPALGRFHLAVMGGVEQDQGRRHSLSTASTVVGREGAFSLHDPAVSRQHLMVSERDGLYFVSSLGDTVLNGVPLQAESELRHGDRLVLSADTTLLFSDSDREAL